MERTGIYDMKETVKLMERHVRERQIDRHRGLDVLCDFLIDMFDIRHHFRKDGFAEYWTELHGKEPYLFRIALIWLDKVATAMEHGTWVDFFGGIYEEMYQSKGKASALGQFFTPPQLCDCMSMMVAGQDSGRVNDAACGSGRTLLSAHAAAGYPPGAYYIGEDIDTSSVKMCALNMMAHGMRGRVVRHDTLKDPVGFDYGFELNEVRYPFPTMFYSLRKISHRPEIVPKEKEIVPKKEETLPKVEETVPKKEEKPQDVEKPDNVQYDLFGNVITERKRRKQL